MADVSYISLRASNVRNNILGKLQITLDIDGTITKSNSRKFSRKESCMLEHLYRHFRNPGHMGFLKDVSVTLTDKAHRSAPKKREDY